MDKITLHNTEDTAKIIGVTTRTIKTYAKSGRLQGQKIGTRWMFSNENIERFLKGERKPEATDALAAFIPGLAVSLRDLRAALIVAKAKPVLIDSVDRILAQYIAPMEIIVKSSNV